MLFQRLIIVTVSANRDRPQKMPNYVMPLVESKVESKEMRSGVGRARVLPPFSLEIALDENSGE